MKKIDSIVSFLSRNNLSAAGYTLNHFFFYDGVE